MRTKLPNEIEYGKFCEKYNKHHTTKPLTKPPSEPSRVLFGLILGAILTEPNFLPMIYAKESFDHTRAKIIIKAKAPELNLKDMAIE